MRYVFRPKRGSSYRALFPVHDRNGQPVSGLPGAVFALSYSRGGNTYVPLPKDAASGSGYVGQPSGQEGGPGNLYLLTLDGGYLVGDEPLSIIVQPLAPGVAPVELFFEPVD